jgi:AcrR family transcriptional regulator
MSKLLQLEDLLQIVETLGAGPGKDEGSRTRARLLQAAMELFQTHGYRRTSIEEIAQAAGVAKGTVYVHFKNKGELLFHAMAEEKRRLLGRAKHLLRGGLTPEQRFREYLEMALLSVSEMPLAHRFLTGDREYFIALEDMAPQLREQIEIWQVQGMEVLLRGVGAFDRLDATERAERIRALVGLLSNASQLMDSRLRGPLSPERYAQLVARILVDGMGAP